MKYLTKFVALFVLVGLEAGTISHAVADSKNPIAVEYNAQGFKKLNTGNYKGAVADFKGAIRIDSGGAEYYHNLGLAQQKLGEIHGAVQNFNNGGVIKLKKGDYRGAIAEFSEAIKLDSNYSIAFHNRRLAKEKLGDAKGAEEDDLEAKRLDRAARAVLVP